MTGATWKFADFHHCLVWSKSVVVTCVWLISINSRWAFQSEFTEVSVNISSFCICKTKQNQSKKIQTHLSQANKQLTLLLYWNLSHVKWPGVIRNSGMLLSKCSDTIHQAGCFLRYLETSLILKYGLNYLHLPWFLKLQDADMLCGLAFLCNLASKKLFSLL